MKRSSAKPSSSKETKRKKTEDKKETTRISTTVGEYDGVILFDDEEVRKRDNYSKPIPKKNSDGILLFEDNKDFRPNMTPKDVLQVSNLLNFLPKLIQIFTRYLIQKVSNFEGNRTIFC